MRYKEGEEDVFTKENNTSEAILKTKLLYSPIIAKWLGKGGKISIENGNWEYTDLRGISVTYKNNYPDFKGSGHVVQEVDTGEFKNYYNDFKRADKLTGGRKDPRHNTWHHHEDQKTLQEINRDIHEMFKHKGGMSLNKKKS